MSIDEKQLLIAIRKSIDNSLELISDADLLKVNERIPRAYALYQLAMEESGKAMEICGRMIFNTLNSRKEQKKFETNFKEIQTKNLFAATDIGLSLTAFSFEVSITSKK